MRRFVNAYIKMTARRMIMYGLWNDDWSFSLKPLGQVPEEGEYEPVNLPHDWQIYDTCDLYAAGDGFYRRGHLL